MQLPVKLTDGAPLPKHAKPGDAGLDLTIRENVMIEPHETELVGCGVAVEIPEGYVGLLFPRSGLATKLGVNLANCVGVIDSGYRGEIKVPLHNASNKVVRLTRGERVCQLIVMPYVTCECIPVEKLSDTERGAGGFGSTGTKS